MKSFFNTAGLAALLALAAPLALRAQTEPIIGVDITQIAVFSGSGAVVAARINSGGSGYTSAPTVTVSGGSGTGAAIAATVTNGAVTALTLTNGGTGYTSTNLPTIDIAPPGTTATATASVAGGEVTGIAVGTAGSGYSAAPTVVFSGGGGSGATATATIANGQVTGITVVSKGTGYTSAPTVTLAAPGAPAAAAVTGIGSYFAAPFQNESYGPVDTQIDITALAHGTYPAAGYTYTFFINGVQLGSPPSALPAGVPAVVSWKPPQPGSYLLTVSVTDGLHTATSLAVRYFATGTAIIGPVDNTLVPNGSSVVLQATATPPPSGPNAFVQRMDFYVDNVLVGSDSTYPYSYIYTPANTPTTHVIEARGFDNNGNQISPNGAATRRLYMVTPIGTPPTVRIVNPPSGGSVPAGSAVTIITDAIAPDGFIKNVDFYLNGVQLSSSQTFPFTATWTPQVPGRYQFVAIAFDDKSNAVASEPIALTVTGAFPTASIANPDRSGFTLVQGSTLPVTVRAAGPDGGVTSLKQIDFLVDGVVNDTLPKAPASTGTSGGTGSTGGTGTGTTPAAPLLTDPFIFNWKANVAVGTHRLSARVTGNNGLSITSSEITVNVTANQPPRVSITAPTASASVTANAATTITAAPTDVDGTVDSVEFFVNGTSIGSATKAPFQVSWTPANAGTFDLTAKATDNGGATAVSTPLTVTVDPAAPSGSTPAAIANTVYRGDYGSATESGRFALALNRNNRGALVAYSTMPAGRSYVWTDIAVNPDGTFTVRDASNQIVLSGQTSATGVSGTFGGKTFIGPITPSNATFTPLLLTGSLNGVPNSQVVAIVGGDSSVTLYTAAGGKSEAGGDFLGATGNYSFAAPTGGRLTGNVANSAVIVAGSVSGGVTGNFLLRQQASRIANISTRALAGSGDRTLLAGFVIAGTGAKPLLVRAVGPTLANFGLANALADPTLSVLSRTSATVASNNDWGNSASLASLATQVGAFPLTPDSRDAAVAVSVAPGTYTAVVGGTGATPGSALIEIYDAENGSASGSRITNISTRGQVGSGDALIAGFVITGDLRKKLLIRAVGPTLAGFGVTGVLADPRIDVMSGSIVIASNNDWTEPTAIAQVNATTPTVGAFPLNANSKDAAMVLQLNPGSYTVQVSGAGNSSGTVLIEIYDADL